MVDNQNLSEQVRVFKALSSELRLQILTKLTDGPMSAPELSEEYDIDVTGETIYNNLRKLEEAKIVRSKEVYGPGNRPRYEFRLNGTPIRLLLEVGEQYQFEFQTS